MGRTNLIILCFGIFACIALSLMMGHAVKLKDKAEVHPAIFELFNIFGDDLRRRPKLEIVDRGGKKVALLTIEPRRQESSDRLSRAVGRYFIRLRGPDLVFQKLEVVAKTRDGKEARYTMRVTGSLGLMNRGFDSTPKKSTPNQGNSSRKPKAARPPK